MTDYEKPTPGTLRYAVQVLAELSDYDFAAAVRRGKVNLVARTLDVKSRTLIKLVHEARGLIVHSGLRCPDCAPGI